MKKFFALVLALVMALSLTTVAWGAGNTITVGASDCNYTSLATAITNASAGDTISIKGGEVLTIGNLAINKSLTITSDPNNKATVNGRFYVETGSASATVTIENLKIVTTDDAVQVRTATNTTVNVLNCDISGLTAQGINVTSTVGTLNIDGCTFTKKSSNVVAVTTEGGTVGTLNFTNNNANGAGRTIYVGKTTNAYFKDNVQGYTKVKLNGSIDTVTFEGTGAGVDSSWSGTVGKVVLKGAATSMSTPKHKVALETSGETTCYTTLAEAVAAADDGDTIKLRGNVTLTGDVVIDKPITIDTNGKTLTGGDVVVADNDLKLVYDQTTGTYTVAEKVYVAEVDGVQYETLAEAVAAADDGDTVKLLADVTITEPLNITKDTVINGNNKTLTYTGATGNRAIDVAKETNGADLTINNLTIAFTKSVQRGINYNTTGTLTLNKVTVGNETACPTYAVNFPSSATGAKASIIDCNLTGLCVVNVWGVDSEVTISGGKIICNDQNASENYGALYLTSGATGAKITATGVTFDIRGDSHIAVKAAKDGEIILDEGVGSVTEKAARIEYGDCAYLFDTVQDAITHAVSKNNATAENPVTVYILEAAATSGGSYTHAEGVNLVLPEGCAEFEVDGKYTVKTIVAKIGTVNYASLQEAVDAVADKGTVTVKVGGETATVKTAKTFTVVGEAATIKAAKGLIISEDKGVYTVKEYVAPPTTDVPAVDIEAEVAAPSVETTVDTSKKSEAEQEVIKDVADALQNDNAVKFDETTNSTLSDEAEKIADKKVTVTDEHIDDLNELFTETVTEDDVAVVVQTNFEVKVEDVTVKDGETTVTLDITPVYQKVVTTKDVAENPTTEIVTKGDDKNAVVVEKGELEITEPVEIKIAIPKALAVSDGANGYKSLYVTHTKDNGTKYVYEAKVEGDDVNGYTATFLNPNGFSSFTLSAVNSTAVTMDGMNYVDLQSAINDLGKGATITVLSGDHTAVVSGNTSFKVVLENGATANITAAKGYNVGSWSSNGVYTYIVTKASAGGYYPSTPSTPAKPSTPSKPVQSADTFDAGIALYVGMSVMAAAGSAVVIGKKRED